MAEGVLSTNAQDVVAVLTADFRQVFAKARAVKATIVRASKTMEHPLETGATVVDYRVVLPTTIELSLILASGDYKAVYQQVRDLFLQGALLTVQTRVDSFASMLIEKIPHDETPEMIDGVALALGLREALFVTPQFSNIKVASPQNSSTVQRGQQQPAETPAASARRSSVLSGVFK